MNLISKILFGIVILCLIILIITGLVLVYDMVTGLKMNISKTKVLVILVSSEIVIFIITIILKTIQTSIII